jgi:hypothetical protein
MVNLEEADWLAIGFDDETVSIRSHRQCLSQGFHERSLGARDLELLDSGFVDACIPAKLNAHEEFFFAENELNESDRGVNG